MKKIILFDFDDTLVYTNEIFLEVKEKFYDSMNKLNLYDEDLPKVLNDFDIANVIKCGSLKKECFPLALKQTYEYYCQKKQIPYSITQSDFYWEMGFKVYREPVRLVPGAIELLNELKDHYLLILLTQGDKELQKSRLENSGLLDYFSSYHIVPRKEVAVYQNIISKLKANPSLCWSIGNSIRYDINPAIKVGLNVIHVEIPCWDYETVEPIAEYHRVINLSDCRKFLLI